jgi:hypothetical protein
LQTQVWYARCSQWAVYSSKGHNLPKGTGGDREPKTPEALLNAAKERSWLVWAAAYDAVAQRGDPALVGQIYAGRDDDNDAVQHSAGAAVIRLSSAKM